VDKGLCFAAIGLPPLGNVQSGFNFDSRQGKSGVFPVRLGFRKASQRFRVNRDTSKATIVNASSSQVLGMWALCGSRTQTAFDHQFSSCSATV
jgi:hypothetical protein